MNDAKTALQVCTESFFRHATAARRRGSREKATVQSLVILAHVPSRKVGKAALGVLREIRIAPKEAAQ